MSAKEKIHILDKDVKRRAQIAYGLASHDYRAQIYENIEEVMAFPPSDGLLLINDNFDGKEVADVTHMIASNVTGVPVVMFGEEPTTRNVVRAIRAGAIDYLEWPFEAESIDSTLARVDRDPAINARAMERRRSASSRVDVLSDREREVLRHLIQGHGSKDIGALLEISPRTVEVHRASLLAKLNARSTSEAIRIGIYGGLDD